MNINKKVAIIHPDRQHSLRTAVSLKNNNIKIMYVTTIFDSNNSLTSKVKFLLSDKYKNKLASHRSDILDESEVIQFCETITLISAFISKIVRIKCFIQIINEFRISIFNRKVFKYLKRNTFDAVIMYDTLAGKLATQIKKSLPNTKVIVDMSAPYYPFMVNIFNKEVALNSNFSKNLKRELSSFQHKTKLKRSKIELMSTDLFIVASSFTKNSLTANGINDDKISIVPYGIDCKNIIKTSSTLNGGLKIIFVGNFNQKKGISHMLNVIDKLNYKNISLTVVGSYIQEYNKYLEYKNKVYFTGHIPKSEVIKQIDQSDIMIFPSLADGFGFSALEAMSRSIPVICSRNAGISDFIVDKQNGFLYDPFNDKELELTLIWIMNNPEKITMIRDNALHTAQKLLWSKYETKLLLAISKI